MRRISIDLGAAVGIAVVPAFWKAIASDVGMGWTGLFGGAARAAVITAGAIALAALIAVLAMSFVARSLAWVARFLRWSRGTTRGSSLRRRVATGVLAGGAAGLILWRVGPGAAWAGITDAAIAALPAAFVLVCGVWACLLTLRRIRASRYRRVRAAADVLVVPLAGLDLLVLFNRDLLATQPAAGFLFPVGVWFSIRTWRAMARSSRLAVRAGADIVLSLLLGAIVVLFLVWGANLLDLPVAEVAVLRGTLERAGSTVDLPWWLWVGLYVLLAGVSLAFALWPARLRAIAQWSQRLRVVPSVDASRRVLSGVHIGLLVTVLIGLAAPTPLEATLRGELKAKYTVALQRELDAAGERAAYEEIRRQFSASNAPVPPVQPLADIVSEVHNISSPRPGDSGATSTERDLARRIGQIQATTLRLDPPPSVLSGELTASGLIWFEAPIRDNGDLRDRLDALDAQQRQADVATRQVDQAAELAAAAVAGAINIPNLGENEIVQIIKEYLSGLVESSPLKEVFSAWAKRLTGRTSPPRADQMVVPDPARLEIAASAALLQELHTIVLADPFGYDQILSRTLSESPASAAVNLTNQARYLEEGSGPCDGCPQPLRPGEEPYGGRGEHDFEPHDIPFR